MSDGYWKGHPFVESELAAIMAIVEGRISVEGVAVSESILEMVRAGGKLLRPAFLVAASRFGSYDPGRIRPLAAAVEILHTATLIHDDVIDNAATRRGVECAHRRFDAKQAVLAGDFLLARCFSLAADATTPEDARALSRLIEAICVAEIGQDMRAYSFDLTERDCLRTIAGKTAAMFSLACHAGAARSGCKVDVVCALRRAGYCVGMAFQAIDDVLDYEADGQALGKGSGRDLEAGLCTLPLVYAMEERGAAIRAELTGLPEAGAIARVAELVRSTQALDRVRAFAATYTERALRELGRLKPSEAREEFMQIVKQLLVRTK